MRKAGIVLAVSAILPLFVACRKPPEVKPFEMKYEQLEFKDPGFSIYAPTSMAETQGLLPDSRSFRFKDNNIEYYVHIRSMSDEEFTNGSYFSPDIRKSRITKELRDFLEQRGCKITAQKDVSINHRYQGIEVDATCGQGDVSSHTVARAAMVDKNIYFLEVISKSDEPLKEKPLRFLDSLMLSESTQT